MPVRDARRRRVSLARLARTVLRRADRGLPRRGLAHRAREEATRAPDVREPAAHAAAGPLPLPAVAARMRTSLALFTRSGRALLYIPAEDEPPVRGRRERGAVRAAAATSTPNTVPRTPPAQAAARAIWFPVFCPDALAIPASRTVLSRDCSSCRASEALIIVGGRRPSLFSVMPVLANRQTVRHAAKPPCRLLVWLHAGGLVTEATIGKSGESGSVRYKE